MYLTIHTDKVTISSHPVGPYFYSKYQGPHSTVIPLSMDRWWESPLPKWLSIAARTPIDRVTFKVSSEEPDLLPKLDDLVADIGSIIEGAMSSRYDNERSRLRVAVHAGLVVVRMLGRFYPKESIAALEAAMEVVCTNEELALMRQTV